MASSPAAASPTAPIQSQTTIDDDEVTSSRNEAWHAELLAAVQALRAELLAVHSDIQACRADLSRPAVPSCSQPSQSSAASLLSWGSADHSWIHHTTDSISIFSLPDGAL